MQRFCLTVAVAALSLVATTALAQKGPRHPMAPIPFEQDRAKERGDRAMLQLNEDASRIPGHRITALPIVNGKMGEQARLDDSFDIYFPFGRILSATTEFHKYRAIPATSEGMAPEFLPDPSYSRVAQFDRVLGKVCASERIETSGGNAGRLELRVAPDKSLSVVRSMPAPHRPAHDESVVSYRVISSMEVRYLAREEPDAERLFRRCQTGSASNQRVSDKN